MSSKEQFRDALKQEKQSYSDKFQIEYGKCKNPHYNYLVDGYIFNNVRGLSNYIGCKSQILEDKIREFRKHPGAFFEIDGYGIIIKDLRLSKS
jgi:hypothetical protein